MNPSKFCTRPRPRFAPDGSELPNLVEPDGIAVADTCGLPMPCAYHEAEDRLFGAIHKCIGAKHAADKREDAREFWQRELSKLDRREAKWLRKQRAAAKALRKLRARRSFINRQLEQEK